MQAPIFGEPNYFDPDKQNEIREDVKNYVKADYDRERGHFPISGIAENIISEWVKRK